MNCLTADEDLLVLREIKRIVKEAEREGILSAGNRAEQIKRAFPQTAFTTSEIADEIMMTAAEAGIPVQVGTARK
jgi:predicted TIM-barrel fold metal-dependent hydrolase